MDPECPDATDRINCISNFIWFFFVSRNSADHSQFE